MTKKDTQFTLVEWMATPFVEFNLVKEFQEQVAPHMQAMATACEDLGLPLLIGVVAAYNGDIFACRQVSNLGRLDRLPAEMLVASKAILDLEEIEVVVADVKMASDAKMLAETTNSYQPPQKDG